MEYRVRIDGLSPLLMHFYNLDAMDDASAKGKTGGKAGDDRYPPDKWKTYAYFDEEHVALPSENLNAALISAGSKISIGRMQTMKQLASLVLFKETHLKLEPLIELDAVRGISGKFTEHIKAAEQLGFKLLVKRVAVGTKSHVRVRPMFSKWSTSATIETLDDDLTEERLKSLFDIAGQRVGVGDWRPSSPKRPGPFGRFSAEICKA